MIGNKLVKKINEEFENAEIKEEHIKIKNKRNKKFKLFGIFKFIFDRMFSIIALIILSPLILIIGILIKLDSDGPVFFKQTRTGKNGKNFELLKFRTMVKDNNLRDLSKEDQHTKLGSFLRKTSLDEIPQLICIALGKMSFIGPRPWIPEYYENMNDEQRKRYLVRPGLTGLAQAKGRNGISIEEKINYDLYYVKNYSLKLDLKIIFLTITSLHKSEIVNAGKNTIKEEIEYLKNNKVGNKNG